MRVQPNLIQTYRNANPNLTIGLIAAKNKQIDTYSDWLTSAGIEHEQVRKDSIFSMAKPGVKVVSAFGAKGLEFNVVIIPMFAEGYFPYGYFSDDEGEMEQFLIKMRNLVYVSMTRAKNILILTWWGDGGSRFISDMNPNFYVSEGAPFIIKKYTAITKKKVNSNKNTKLIEKPPIQISSKIQQNIVEESTTVMFEETPEIAVGLVDYMKQKGLAVVDKRSQDGCLWLIGGKDLDPIVKETRKRYGTLWTFSQNGSVITGYKSAWYTKCKK